MKNFSSSKRTGQGPLQKIAKQTKIGLFRGWIFESHGRGGRNFKKKDNNMLSLK